MARPTRPSGPKLARPCLPWRWARPRWAACRAGRADRGAPDPRRRRRRTRPGASPGRCAPTATARRSPSPCSRTSWPTGTSGKCADRCPADTKKTRCDSTSTWVHLQGYSKDRRNRSKSANVTATNAFWRRNVEITTWTIDEKGNIE